MALVLRSRRDEWIIALPACFNIYSGRHHDRESLNSTFRQNFDEATPDALMNDLCGISATPGRGNEEISVETRLRGQCRSQSWNQYGPVLGYRSRLLGFHRSLGSEAVSSSGVRWVPWVPTRARGRLPILSVLGPTFQSTIVDRMGG